MLTILTQVLTQVRMCAHSLTQVLTILTVLTVLTQVRMCAHRALTTIGQSFATATGREPWSSSLAGVTVWPQRYARTVVQQCVRLTPLRVEANTAQQ